MGGVSGQSLQCPDRIHLAQSKCLQKPTRFHSHKVRSAKNSQGLLALPEGPDEGFHHRLTNKAVNPEISNTWAILNDFIQDLFWGSPSCSVSVFRGPLYILHPGRAFSGFYLPWEDFHWTILVRYSTFTQARLSVICPVPTGIVT